MHKKISFKIRNTRTILVLIYFIIGYNGYSKIWNVGPSRTYKFCSQVVSLVQYGDTVDIDSAVYTNDAQVTWTMNKLLIRGINGRPRLVAGALIANDAVNGKGIFVIQGSDVTVENIEFRDALVQSHNGAGIRQEGRNLLVRYCKFQGNEMGILGGNIANCTVIVEYCEFLQGGSNFDPGYQHNIYINHIDSFVFRYNYSYDAIASGHELKSRATHNFILFNRLANISTIDSRTIDLPNGGFALVMGNIIEQGMNSSNSNLLGYGLEGFTNPGPQHLMVINNTFVNKKDKGSFIHVPASGIDTLTVKNNIMAGPKTGGLIIGSPTVLDSGSNFICDLISDAGFVNASGFDYHLTSGSKALNAGMAVSGRRRGYPLKPWRQYRDQCGFEARPVNGAIDIGAFERPAPAGISAEMAASLKLYPNPVSDELIIEMPYNGKITALSVCDAAGKFVLKEEICNSAATIKLDVGKLTSGIYQLLITTDHGVAGRKFAVSDE